MDITFADLDSNKPVDLWEGMQTFWISIFPTRLNHYFLSLATHQNYLNSFKNYLVSCTHPKSAGEDQGLCPQTTLVFLTHSGYTLTFRNLAIR